MIEESNIDALNPDALKTEPDALKPDAKKPNSGIIGIKQLKMLIKTSIPDKDEYIEFTSELLPIKSKGKPFTKYPFFSNTHSYPKLKLQNFKYEQVVEFFFNKDIFLNIIKNKTRKNLSEKEESENEIKIANFELTLRLLFPTNFPLVNNIDNSIETIIPTKKIFTLKGSNLFNILPSRFDNKFSYLKIGSETYTITKVIWKNDVMNHPIYNKIVQAYKEFDEWITENPLSNGTSEADIETMNTILSYIFDAVQKSEETPFFKPMYPDTKNAPYTNVNKKRLDENTLSIQEFDNTINEIMKKNETVLLSENEGYIKTYDTLLAELKKKTEEETEATEKEKLNKIIQEIEKTYNSVSTIDFVRFTSLLNQKIDDITQKELKQFIYEKVNEILTVIEQIYKNKQEINKLKKDKNKDSSDYYLYFQKEENLEKKEKSKAELLKKDPKYKLKLINLFGKLTSIKSTHNVSPDLLNLIEYLKTKVTDFNSKRKITGFIQDLNIQFLSNPNYKNELQKIKTLYVEFYNLAIVIKSLKGRNIDNVIWKDIIFKIMNGTLKENEFNDKIWVPLQDCYHLNDETTATTSKKCDPNSIMVGLDILPIPENTEKDKLTTNIQMIEIYLQIDLIEGKIDDTNINDIKCGYEDEFLGTMFRNLMNYGKQINTLPDQQAVFSAKKVLDTIKVEKKGGKRKTIKKRKFKLKLKLKKSNRKTKKRI